MSTDPTPSGGRDATVRTVWVTGAGSGVGRAVAVSAARAGARVVLTGRRPDALAGTASLVRDAGGEVLELPADTGRDDQLQEAWATLQQTWGDPTDLVLSAGLNHPRRYWRDQTMADFRAIVDTNLTAAALVVDLALPALRAAGGGVVVFVSSVSGWQFSPDAGVAYSASKTAVGSLAAHLNAQENRHGVRACAVCPGDIDSDFLSLRPVVPGAGDRVAMLSPDDVARTVQFVLDSPPHVCVNELVVTPTKRDPAPR
ncbi:NADP-dependent 3-hydroxy acid dehydrogenase YdfG [Friedmanniella luteola]|uniref:NADP-dependent 3-hydroxy acid dehydrogenase YdfG n=1 Tax=Friedmanniella luteola TaxID=546871 RepID=A0A1H1ZB93_9ACTN|nr:SDR family NAD(P)-dependent oxidoreductase [Friedmanniella luteola]SDT30903.1 NADP-dependent 3-hydroxy acid dehydrogenase YdfG [Friedmanniella luteola]